MSSISNRLSRYMVSVFALVFSAAMVFVLLSTDKVIALEAEKTASHTLEAAALEIEKSLLSILEDTKDLQWDSVMDINPNVLSYKYITVPAHSADTTMDWYRIPLKSRKPVWTEPYESKTEPGSMVFAFGYPVLDHGGNVQGIAMSEVKLDWLTRIINEDKFRPYKHSATSILSAEGVFLASSNPKINFKPGIDVIDNTGVQLLHGKADMGSFNYAGIDNFFVFGHMSNGWTVTIVSQYKDVFEGTFLMRSLLIIISLLSFVLFILVTKAAMNSVTRPLRQFSSAAHTIATGNFEVQLPRIKHNDEVKELRDSFDNLQTSLSNYITNLKQTTAAKERLESELSIAHKIQQDLLPERTLDTDDLQVSSLLVPAKEVGGDLYDYSLSENILYFSVGDVSGKGIPASLLMSSTQSAYRFNRGLGASEKMCIERINNYLSAHNFENMFVTMFAGRLDMNTYKLEYCNAGHNCIVICPPNREPYLLKETPNFVLGIIENFEYVQESVQLEKGYSIILYSDGVTEAESCTKELYGEKRLLDWAARFFSAGSDCCTDSPAFSLYKDIKSFTYGNEQNDDITIMIVRF